MPFCAGVEARRRAAVARSDRGPLVPPRLSTPSARGRHSARCSTSRRSTIAARCSSTASSVGTHQGGNTPFSFDVTDALRPASNELVVRVEDETEGWQLRGKQVRQRPRHLVHAGVRHLADGVAGASRPAVISADLTITPTPTTGTITVRPEIGGTRTAAAWFTWSWSKTAANRSPRRPRQRTDELSVTIGGSAIVVARFAAPVRSGGRRCWMRGGTVLDRVAVLCRHSHGRQDDGMPTATAVHAQRRADLPLGPARPGLVAGRPAHAAVRRGACVFDIEFLKAAGFNMIRKHIKVEPRRYYYHCDRTRHDGLAGPGQRRAAARAVDAARSPTRRTPTGPTTRHAQFMVELERMIDTLENHPVASWCGCRSTRPGASTARWRSASGSSQRDPDAPGQHRQRRQLLAGRATSSMTTAIRIPAFPSTRRRGSTTSSRSWASSADTAVPVQGHLWDAKREQLGLRRPAQGQGRVLRNATRRRSGCSPTCAGRASPRGVYTQTTDVEGEINGLMTYDRKVIKIPARELAELHQQLFAE